MQCEWWGVCDGNHMTILGRWLSPCHERQSQCECCVTTRNHGQELASWQSHWRMTSVSYSSVCACSQSGFHLIAGHHAVVWGSPSGRASVGQHVPICGPSDDNMKDKVSMCLWCCCRPNSCHLCPLLIHCLQLFFLLRLPPVNGRSILFSSSCQDCIHNVPHNSTLVRILCPTKNSS